MTNMNKRERDMRAWAEKECDECGNIATLSRSEPKDFNAQFTCSDCVLSNKSYDAGYKDGLKKAREKPEKKPSKAKLWRRVARLVGELILSRGPGEYPGRISFALCEVVVRDVIRAWGDEPSRITKKQSRILAKLKSAFAAWESAQ